MDTLKTHLIRPDLPKPLQTTFIYSLMYISVCPFICLYLSFDLSSVYSFVCLSVYMSVCLSICLSIYMTFYLSVCPFMYISAYPL